MNSTNPNGRAAIFKERRARFMAEIGAAAAILPSAPIALRSNDVEFVYRQDNDFYYLTGFAEPESVAVFAPGHKDGEFVMFVRPRDKRARDLDRAARRDRRRDDRLRRRQGLHHRRIRTACCRATSKGVERVYYPLGLNEQMNERVLG